MVHRRERQPGWWKPPCLWDQVLCQHIPRAATSASEPASRTGHRLSRPPMLRYTPGPSLRQVLAA